MAEAASAPPVRTAAELVASRKLTVVTGKGGVGRSAVAAALGRLAAAAGRRCLVLEVDPREAAHALLGVPPAGGEVVEADGLWLRNLDPRREIDEFVDERLRIGPLVRRVLASEVYRHFVEGAPGLKELAVLGHALRVLGGTSSRRGSRFESVVLDGPATGHGVSLLEAPFLAAGVIRGGPFERVAVELSELIADRERCAIVGVTLAEDMPVQETLELDATLGLRFGRSFDLVVVNGLYPPVAPGPARRPAPRSPVARLWRRRREINESQLARLLAGAAWPVIEIPLLAIDGGPVLVREIAGLLARPFGGGGE